MAVSSLHTHTSLRLKGGLVPLSYSRGARGLSRHGARAPPSRASLSDAASSVADAPLVHSINVIASLADASSAIPVDAAKLAEMQVATWAIPWLCDVAPFLPQDSLNKHGYFTINDALGAGKQDAHSQY